MGLVRRSTRGRALRRTKPIWASGSGGCARPGQRPGPGGAPAHVDHGRRSQRARPVRDRPAPAPSNCRPFSLRRTAAAASACAAPGSKTGSRTGGTSHPVRLPSLAAPAPTKRRNERRSQAPPSNGSSSDAQTALRLPPRALPRARTQRARTVLHLHGLQPPPRRRAARLRRPAVRPPPPPRGPARPPANADGRHRGRPTPASRRHPTTQTRRNPPRPRQIDLRAGLLRERGFEVEVPASRFAPWPSGSPSPSLQMERGFGGEVPPPGTDRFHGSINSFFYVPYCARSCTERSHNGTAGNPERTCHERPELLDQPATAEDLTPHHVGSQRQSRRW